MLVENNINRNRITQPTQKITKEKQALKTQGLFFFNNYATHPTTYKMKHQTNPKA
jgi:hypothetical protein